MSIQIEILSTKVVTKPTKVPGKTYNVLEVAYKNLTFQGKVEGRNVMSFGATAESYKALSIAQTGDVFDIDVVKNAQGYNDWVSAKKSVGVASQAQPTTRTSTQGSSSTPAPRNTYETPEERAKKQVFIVRQSSISSAVEILKVGAKSPPNTDDILKVARQLEGFVFGDDLKDDVPSMRIEDIQDSEID